MPPAPGLAVALLAHIRHPVAPPFRGGMEAHAWELARMLAARGHRVTLLASGDSRPPPGVALVPIVARHYDADFPWHAWHGTAELDRHLDAAYARASAIIAERGFDLVHNNSLHRYPPRVARERQIAMVTSLHVPPFDALRRAVWESAAPWCRFTVPSSAQADRWWPAGRPPEAEVLPNGIDLAAWPYQPRGDGSAVWAGRITPNKGTADAVRAARLAGLPLVLYGVVEHRDYFEQQIRPLLGDGIAYGGHLEGAALARAVGRASVMLFTPLWDEPFGLAAAEALACGVPVAGYASGATAEVVGDAGALAPAGDVAALARAVPRALAVPRPLARRRAHALFDQAAMVRRLEQLYAAALAGRDAPRPTVRFPCWEVPALQPA